MTDQEKVMSWLEGLSQDDWRQFHSDSEVSNIAKAALALLKEQEETMVDRQNEDGTWSEAEPIPYYPGLFERIAIWFVNRWKKFVR